MESRPNPCPSLAHYRVPIVGDHGAAPGASGTFGRGYGGASGPWSTSQGQADSQCSPEGHGEQRWPCGAPTGMYVPAITTRVRAGV